MKHQFNQQVAINIFAIFVILWLFGVGYQRFVQKGEVSFLGTVIYFDMVLFVAIFAGFIYKKRKKVIKSMDDN